MSVLSKLSTAIFCVLTFVGTPSVSYASEAEFEVPVELPGRSGPVYDFGTLKGVGLEQLGTCLEPYEPDAVTKSGHTIKMLGAAFVYMGPSNGSSILGHTAERFVYCRDQQVYDGVYEYEMPEPGTLGPNFEKEYGVDLNSFTEEAKAKFRSSLYLNITFNPAEYYAEQQIRVNRTIYETWFDVDGATMYKMLQANVARYQEQIRKIKAHEDLPPYSVLHNNCATPVKDDVAIVNPEFLKRHSPLRLTPAAIYRGMKKKNVRQIILYPSQHVLRLLRLKQAGKSRAFEGFVPVSKTLKGAFRGSWVLLYDRGDSPWRKILLSPVTGGVNLVAGVSETAYGILTTPISLVAKAIHPKRKSSDKIGLKRAGKGVGDMLKSFAEIFWVKLRFPRTTEWSEEEIIFFRDLQENSALLESMRAEWQTAPIVIPELPRD